MSEYRKKEKCYTKVKFIKGPIGSTGPIGPAITPPQPVSALLTLSIPVQLLIDKKRKSRRVK